MSTGTEDGVRENADLPPRTVTVNQLVGYNMAWYRNAAKLTQEELGKRLGGWTKVAVSAAEHSWDGKRVRQFDADELVAIAAALGVPVIALLLPPSDAGTAVEYTFTAGAVPPMDTPGLLNLVLPDYSDAELPSAAAFRERLMALGAGGVAFPVANEVLQRAADEARKMLDMAREQALETTGDARARAESLERDAQERHRVAMRNLIAPLVKEREELERRVNDLRAFEREYRSRLDAYIEGQLRELRAGVPDRGGAVVMRASASLTVGGTSTRQP